jgi:hypothetical protein
VLLAGGDKISPTDTGVSGAELYDPASGLFAAGPTLKDVRWKHTATRLTDGRVLLAGGQKWVGDGEYVFVATAEVYDPATGETTPTGSLLTARARAMAVLLPSGRVLVTGGFNENGNQASAELYDPETGLFTATGSMSIGRSQATATMLENGSVLVVGDVLGSETAELYDPAAGSFALTGSLSPPRAYHAAQRLTNDKVLIVGGYYAAEYENPKTAQIYDPVTGKFTDTAALAEGRNNPSATLLADGRVLVAGGMVGSSSAELFDPGDLGIDD